VVAIGAAAGGIGEALNLCIARCDQHVQKAGDVGGVGGNRVGDAARHAAQRSLVQHMVDGSLCIPAHSCLAVLQLPDVSAHHAEARPLLRLHQGLNFVQVVLMAGGKTVQPHHLLVKPQEGFEQVAADEASHAGD